MMNKTTMIGRAKTVLVFGQGDAATAVVSSILARVRRDSSRKRLVFRGSADFGPEVSKHLSETVLTAVDRIVHGLGLKTRNFEVSVVNLGAASAVDLGLSISGFSADTAALLALLSATLKIPLAQTYIVTGHIASPDGDIRTVSNMPVKLAAVLGDPSNTRFIFPSVDADGSLQSLSPAERQETVDAFVEAKGRIRMDAVSDVSQLLQASVGDDAVVLASLRTGFFAFDNLADHQDSPVDRVVYFLTNGNESRFWQTLDNYLLSSKCKKAKELLLARTQYQVRKKKYPEGFGRRLLQLIQSLPPSTRRLKTVFPLLPMDKCLDLARAAREEDQEDVKHLLDAALGKALGRERGLKMVAESTTPATRDAYAAVDAILDEINAEALANRIGRPIDSARASYVIEDVIIESHEGFHDAISAFYLFLLRRTDSIPASVDGKKVAPEAFALLERTFKGKGGTVAALSEARYGINGGMRLVLDVMTEQLKTERQASHVSRVLKEAIDPLDWSARVEFMRAFLDRLGPQLSPEIREQPPERFARHYEIILQAYVRSLDQVKQLLRNF
jgi:hypothetical protein